MFNNKPKGQAFTPNGSTSTNTWATLCDGTTPSLANPSHMTPSLGKAELDRLMGLRRWWTASNGNVASRGIDNQSDSGDSSGLRGKHGVLTLSEAREGMYFDPTFKVRLQAIASLDHTSVALFDFFPFCRHLKHRIRYPSRFPLASFFLLCSALTDQADYACYHKHPTSPRSRALYL